MEPRFVVDINVGCLAKWLRVSGFSRCVRCNEPLRAVLRDDVVNRLPSYVYDNHTEVMECPRCYRLYWRGAHWPNMVSELDKVYQESV